MSDIILREARPDDAEALARIYAYYVEHTAVSYELEAPTVGEFRRRMEEYMADYPYLVATDPTGRPLGYAYAHRFHPRAAFAHCVESTVYVAREARGRHIGSLLMDALEDRCRQQGILNMYAAVATTDTEDEYLTLASVRFHSARGYRLVGELRQCGRKFGRWYHMVWMEKMLGEHPE